MRYAAMFLGAMLALAGCNSNKSALASGDGGADAAAVLSPDYATVSKILGGPEQSNIGTCAAGSCHGGTGNAHAMMNFKTAKNLVEVLVNVPACENSSMMRVKPGDPDHSWLWIKLTAAINNTNDGMITFAGTASACPGVSSAVGFGTRMPQVFGSFDKLTDAELGAIKGWIAAGAHGP